jgi:hypothetical protein
MPPHDLRLALKEGGVSRPFSRTSLT